jgi:hypothetical protein
LGSSPARSELMASRPSAVSVPSSDDDDEDSDDEVLLPLMFRAWLEVARCCCCAMKDMR